MIVFERFFTCSGIKSMISVLQNVRKYCNYKAGRSLRWKATGDGGLYQFVILEATMQSCHTPGAVTHNTIVKGALFMEPKPRSNKQENGADYGARLFL